MVSDQERQKWLVERKKGIGGSDAACILGLNPWKTNVQLWKEKTGKGEPEDISNKDVVVYGKRAEEHLRHLFELDFPEYEVGYDEFKLFHNADTPFIFATLDGWLTAADGRKGVLEIKTTEIMNSRQWQKWNDNNIPDNYYIQVLHQLLATGYDFAVLKAQIKHCRDDEMSLTTRHYFIEREEVKSDIELLKKKEIEFWDMVQNKIEPPLLLPSI